MTPASSSASNNLLRPVRLPHVRDRLARHWRDQRLARMALLNVPSSFQCFLPGVDAGQPDQFAVHIKGAPAPQAVDAFCEHIGNEIADCALYWVSGEFGRLARDAAQDLPDLIIGQHEMPSPSGLIVYEDPVWENMWTFDDDNNRVVATGVTDVEAMSWFTTPLGVWMTMYVRPERQMPDVPLKRLRDEVGFLLAHSPGGGAPFGAHHDVASQSPVISILLSTWLLIQQPGVAAVEPGPVDKGLKRRYDRAGARRYPDVNVVNLRRRPVPEGRDAATRTGRRLEDRHLVHGHWKDQAYGPGRALRRRTYVADYWRGPDDAPVKVSKPVVKKLA